MKPPVRFLLVTVVFLVVLGCSKKSEPSPTGEQQLSEPVAPGTTAPPNSSPKKSAPKADPDAAIADLRAKGDSYDVRARQAALKQFSDTIPPTHPRRADAFRALVETAQKATGHDHRSQLHSMIPSYAVGEDIPVLVELVDSNQSTLTLYDLVTRRMRELKDARAAPAAARWYGSRKFNQADPHAGPVLHALGTAAIPSMLPYMKLEAEGGVKPWPMPVKLSALSLFRDFGTEDCIPVLKLYLTDSNEVTRKRFQEAITAIEQRAAKGKS